MKKLELLSPLPDFTSVVYYILLVCRYVCTYTCLSMFDIWVSSLHGGFDVVV
jgi:hypothetical protein